MSFDRKLRKTIEKDCETPELSFEDWAEKHNITLNMPVETNEVTQEHVHVGGGVLAKRVGACAVAVLLTFFIMFPVIYGFLTKTPGLKRYSVNDVINITSSVEEIQGGGLYMFDTLQFAQVGTAYKEVSSDEHKVLLGYFIDDSLIAVGEEAFRVSYRAVVYENYTFIQPERFENLKNSVVIRDKQINYSIKATYKRTIGYASFKVGDYSYYLSAEGFEDITPNVTEENFLELLDAILK